MTTPTTGNSLRTAASTTSSYADDALNSAEQALGTTRQLATQAIEKASEKVRDLRVGMKDLASKGMGSAGDAAAAAQKQLSRYADATGRYVADQPVKSVLIAAAAGAVIAALVVAARRRNQP
ncbi:MAG: DUF883 family protein [Burkholderiales bacterium]|nr:DUF883 family protein [Burkholderiales bacterium]